MVRRGDLKYIAVNGYPAQLFDLKKDPARTSICQASLRMLPRSVNCVPAQSKAGAVRE